MWIVQRLLLLNPCLLQPLMFVSIIHNPCLKIAHLIYIVCCLFVIDSKARLITLSMMILCLLNIFKLYIQSVKALLQFLASRKVVYRYIYIQRITMCPRGYHHSGFMATPALGTQDVLFIYNIIHIYCGIISYRVLNGELLYTKILEVNFFAFAHRLFHEDFSSIIRDTI